MSGFVDPVPAGTLTIGGKTFGPALPLGRHVHSEHTNPPRLTWIHADELRDLVAKAGWATPEVHEQVSALLVHEKNARLNAEARVEELQQKVDDLEKALGWKPKPKPAAKKNVQKES